MVRGGRRPPDPFGAPIPRKEDGHLVTGRGRYVGDIEFPRVLHVAFVRSVHAHARLRTIDTASAYSPMVPYGETLRNRSKRSPDSSTPKYLFRLAPSEKP